MLPGLEVASYLIGKASSVTLVGRQPEPLQAVLGTKVGAMVRKVRIIADLPGLPIKQKIFRF